MADREISNLEEFLTLYPWPEHMLEKGKPLQWHWFFDLPGDRDAIWSYISDTSRLNRALGLSEMKFEERDGVMHGESRNGGVQQQWIEEPWDWVAGHSLQNVRVFQRGLAHFGRGVFHLDAIDDQTIRYHVYFGFIPRGVLGPLFLRIGIPGLQRDFQRVLDSVTQQITATHEPPDDETSDRADDDDDPAPGDPLAIATTSALATASQHRLNSIRHELRRRMEATESDELVEAVDELVEHIVHGDELDLYRIQIKALATRWGVDLRGLLHLFLHATRLGLLRLSWDVICPHCRGVREEAKTLGDVPRLGECDVCEIDFSANKENSVEITFHVHPSIRDIPRRFFCSAEPATKRHIRVQKRVGADESTTLPTRLDPGRYRIRLVGEERYRYLDIAASPSSRDNDRHKGADKKPVSWRASEDRDLSSGPDPVLELRNDGEATATFIVEKALWSDVALRPADLFNLQEFRDLFSEEYLAADIQLDVGEQTILFTDMVGSTRFYAARGDPEAFIEIKKHFTELYEIVDRNHGAVVKTIGDAVMAAFGDPLDAVKASHEIHQRFDKDRDDTPIRLRISLNTGPCIAVNLQSNIDYFGGTVNLAAKLQACAESGEIAMAASVMDAPGVRSYVEAQNPSLEEISFQPRALDRAMAVTRWSTFQRAPENA